MEAAKSEGFEQTQQLKAEIHKTLNRNKIEVESLLYSTESLQSCSRFLGNLLQYERRADVFLESGTSGDSSPCYSETDESKRVSVLTLRETAKLLADESSFELDENYENVKTSSSTKTRLLITGINESMTKSNFKDQLDSFKLKGRRWEDYFKLRDLQFIFFNTEWSLKISIEIKRDSISKYLTMMFTDPKIKKLLGENAKVHWVKDYKMGSDTWFAAVFRNIPYFVKKEAIETLCKKEGESVQYVGPITQVKQTGCCIVRFATLEDAENVTKRLHNFGLRYGSERYLLKAHIHPYGRYKHNEDKHSLFSMFFKTDYHLDAPPARTQQLEEPLHRSSSSRLPVQTDTQTLLTLMKSSQSANLPPLQSKESKLPTEISVQEQIEESNGAGVEASKPRKNRSKSSRQPSKKPAKQQTAQVNNSDDLTALLSQKVDTQIKETIPAEQPLLHSSLSLLVSKVSNQENDANDEIKREENQAKAELGSKNNASTNDIANVSTVESRKKEITPEKKHDNEPIENSERLELEGEQKHPVSQEFQRNGNTETKTDRHSHSSGRSRDHGDKKHVYHNKRTIHQDRRRSRSPRADGRLNYSNKIVHSRRMSDREHKHVHEYSHKRDRLSDRQSPRGSPHSNPSRSDSRSKHREHKYHYSKDTHDPPRREHGHDKETAGSPRRREEPDYHHTSKHHHYSRKNTANAKERHFSHYKDEHSHPESRDHENKYHHSHRSHYDHRGDDRQRKPSDRVQKNYPQRRRLGDGKRHKDWAEGGKSSGKPNREESPGGRSPQPRKQVKKDTWDPEY